MKKSKLEVRDVWNNSIIQPNNGVYVVLDSRKYSFKYISDDKLTSSKVYLEDVNLDGVHCSFDNYEIIINEDIHFIDSRGVVDLKVNNEEFSFDVLSNKLSYLEVEEMILYLYDQDEKLIYNFFSRNKSKVNKVVQSKSDIPLSSKYIKKIISILYKYEKLLPNFINLPHTVIRKEEVMCDYGHTSKEYDINWLLCNLDNIEINDLYQNHPNSINLGGEFGWINKIKAYDNIISYNNYENCVILGGLLKIQNEIVSAKKIITNTLKYEGKKSNSNQLYKNIESEKYVSFSDIKCVHLQKINSELETIYNRVLILISRYEKLFKTIGRREALEATQRLKYTPIFKSFIHYKEIFKEVLWLYNNKYNLDGELDLLGLKNVSQLYELFCHLQLRDGLRIVCKNDFFEDGTRFTHKQTNEKVTLFYQPNIKTTYQEDSELELINIGIYNKSHYTPDFVIKLELRNETKYIILDAKYSRISSVKKYSLTDCTLKYIVDIGIYNDRYKKADFLFILNPESNFNSYHLAHNNTIDLIKSEYSPRIGSLCIKPTNNNEFIDFITELFLDLNLITS